MQQQRAHVNVSEAGAEHRHSHRARLVAQPPNVACRFECCSPLLLHGQHLERANRGHTQQGLCTSGGPATSSAASMACWRHCEQHRRGATSLAGAWGPQTRWPAEPYNRVWNMRFCFRQQVLHLEGRQLARLVRGGAHRQLLVSQQGGRRGVQLGGVVHGLHGECWEVKPLMSPTEHIARCPRSASAAHGQQAAHGQPAVHAQPCCARRACCAPPA